MAGGAVVGPREALQPAPREAPRWRRAGAALAQFLFPRICAACDDAMGDHEEGIVCGRCWTRLAVLPSPRCARCGHPKRSRGECSGCALLPAYVRSARSLAWIPDPVGSRILAALKYEGWPAVADGIGLRLSRMDFPADVIRERAALVPVPLAPVKQRARGFNQAERLARAVARHWGIPVWDDVLQRTRATPSQTRLTPGERLANVHGAFLAASSRHHSTARLRGLHLILVDDVLTTGATLNACASALFAAGARTLSYLTFGRARASGDR